MSIERSTRSPTRTSGPTPRCFQVAGELVGATLELTVGYVSVFKEHRGRVG